MLIAVLLVIIFLAYFLIEDRSAEKVVQPLVVVGIAFCEFGAYVGSLEEKSLILLIFFMWFMGIKGARRSDLSFFKIEKLDYAVSLLLFAYLAAQAFRSAIVYPRGVFSLYWPVFFGCLLVLSRGLFRCNSLDFECRGAALLSSSRVILGLLCVHGVLITISYLLVALNLIHPGAKIPYKTTLLFPFTCFLPLIFLHFKYDSRRWRYIAMIVAILGIVGAILVSSRASLAPMLFVACAMLIAGRGHILRRALIILAAVCLVGAIMWYFRLDGDFVQTLADTIRLVLPNTAAGGVNSDIDRVLHYAATWEVSRSDWSLFLFGSGFRSAGFLLAPVLSDYYRTFLPWLDFETELGSYSDAYTFGWNGILLDVGAVGVVIIFLCMLRNIFLILKRATGVFRVVLLASVAVLVFRLFANNYSSMMLFYFMIAPGLIFGYFLRVEHALRMKPAGFSEVRTVAKR
jgi:hypothetical protein